MPLVSPINLADSREACSFSPIRQYCTSISLLLLSVVNAAAQGPNPQMDFRDVAALAGLNFMNVCGERARKDYILESTGCGVECRVASELIIP